MVAIITMCVSEVRNNRSPSNLKFIVIYFYYSIPAEIGLFTMKGVTKLITDALGIH